MSNLELIYVMVYVDDLIITGTNESFIQRFIQQLDHMFALKDLGSLKYFLGISITRSPSALILSQENYIRDICDRTHMSSATPISTFTDVTSRLMLHGEPFSDPKLYKQVVGLLQ